MFDPLYSPTMAMSQPARVEGIEMTEADNLGSVTAVSTREG